MPVVLVDLKHYVKYVINRGVWGQRLEGNCVTGGLRKHSEEVRGVL